MNKKFLPFLWTLSLCAEDSGYLIDRIEAVVFGSEVNEVVTWSDTQRPSLEGKMRTKDEVITEVLIAQDAFKLRIMADEKTIDEYMGRVAKSFGATVQDLEQIFEQSGYSVEDGRQAFARMYANRQVVEYKIASRIIIPENEVLAYYEANPVYKPASYIVERAFVYVPPGREEYYRKKVDILVKTGKGLLVQWRQLPEVAETDLAADKQFITALKPGEIGSPEKSSDGYELFRLKTANPARLVPLADRYREITELLRQPKFEELFETYKKELQEHTEVLYF